VNKTRYEDIIPYVTKDGSEIRELMHPGVHANSNHKPPDTRPGKRPDTRFISLAEATVPVGTSTKLHKHLRSEELYHIVSGVGEMALGEYVFMVHPGDTVSIEPYTAHMVKNTGEVPLRILCASSPPYSHDDTVLL
jgi:mannose-6-phosphate isomerase-like protein (cupin superfamily)